jgi:hypothetical protein
VRFFLVVGVLGLSRQYQRIELMVVVAHPVREKLSISQSPHSRSPTS